MHYPARAIESLAGLLVAIAVGCVVCEFHLPEKIRPLAQRTRATAEAPQDDTASLPQPRSEKLDGRKLNSHTNRKEVQSRAQAASASRVDSFAEASHRTKRSKRMEVLEDERSGPGVPVEESVMETAKKKPSFRLPLFYSLDDEKIAALIPAVTAAGLKALKQGFEEEAGVGVLTVDDPAYAERWKQAELTLEQRMRLWYGWAAWGVFEHEAALQASAAADAQSAP